MNIHGLSYRSRLTQLSPLLTLLAVYFFSRLLFQQFTAVKLAFIYPTGIIVQLFSGIGDFIHNEWLFGFHPTLFVLGETCSGTTFFSLLIAYFAFRIRTHHSSWLWLLAAYPIAIIANSMRVLCSIWLHQLLTLTQSKYLLEYAHVFMGVTVFLCCFLIIAYAVERPHYLVSKNG